MRVVYVNGRWRNYNASLIHVEDRGFQFADGVYEALSVVKGQLVDKTAHLARLKYSLGEIKLAPPVAFNVFSLLMAEAVRLNYVKHGLLYLQITRGLAKRDHPFPAQSKSSLVIIARHLSKQKQAARQQGIHVITHPDERWKRCDIKSLNLLANVLAREEAAQQDAQEAWLINEQGIITEGTASNAWLIKGNRLYTHEASHPILNGITRQKVMGFASQLQLEVVEAGFSREDAFTADGAFISSSIGGIIPVLSIDGVPVPQNQKIKQFQALSNA